MKGSSDILINRFNIISSLKTKPPQFSIREFKIIIHVQKSAAIKAVEVPSLTQTRKIRDRVNVRKISFSSMIESSPEPGTLKP